MPDATPLSSDGDVSVIVVAYREKEMLTKCLQSFQRHRPDRVGQVIVIDNSPADEQRGTAQQFPWMEHVANPTNVHFRRGVNQGVRRARGRYILLLNPDTYLTDSQSIGLLADVLDRDSSVGFVGPKLRGDDGKLAPQGEHAAGIAFLIATKTYLNVLWPGNPVARRHNRPGDPRERSGPAQTVTAAAVMLRRDEYLRVGGLDESVSAYWEEHELARKYQRLGLHGYYRADAFIFHHWRKGGTAHEPDWLANRHFEEAMRLYYRRFYGPLGGLLYDALDAFQRLLRRASRGRAQSRRASTT